MEKIKKFWKNHKTKILIVGGCGLCYLGGRMHAVNDIKKYLNLSTENGIDIVMLAVEDVLKAKLALIL